MHTFLATLTVLLTTFPEGGLPLPLSLQEQHHLSLAHPPQPFLVNCSQHSAWHSTDSMQFWRMHELVNHWRSWSADKKALHGCSCLKHTSCCRKQEAGRPELQWQQERTPLPLRLFCTGMSVTSSLPDWATPTAGDYSWERKVVTGPGDEVQKESTCPLGPQGITW